MSSHNNDLYDFKHISDVPAAKFVNICDYESIAETLTQVPHVFRRNLLDQYETIYSEYQQDKHLKASECRVRANQFFCKIRQYTHKRHFLNYSDESLQAKAKRLARYTAKIMRENNYLSACHFVESNGIDVPYKQWQSLSDTAQWQPIKARLIDEYWWMRQLIKKHDREFEEAAIRFGQVRKNKQAYVSTATLEKITHRHKRSLEKMRNLLMVSDEGDEVALLDVLKASPANPAVRRAELMNRLYGFEQYADQHEHVAEFYTMTAPSKYHPSSHKYNHWTPRQTQQHYFAPMWARIRAKLKNQGRIVYGFRIAEGHGDACPHWHILLFMSKADRLPVREILKDYALREDSNERGAARNRFDFEIMSKDKGSAIAYIAKYISKNVDGFGMEMQTEEETNLPINESAQRVRAWASVWGIRQFQQIGGSSISVWRELRRLADKQADPILEAARKAADCGDWKAYLEAQGGTDIAVKDQPIQLYHQTPCDQKTGEVHTNQYGEIIDVIKGVQTQNGWIATRLKQWTIQINPDDDTTLQECDVKDSTMPLLDGTDQAFDLPWSSVNNCRITEKEYEEFSGFSSPRRE